MSQPVTEPTTTVTPNNMPGAAPTATQTPDKAPPATTTPTAPATTTEKATETAPETGASLTADERSELEMLRKVRTEERPWEKRAKENADAAKKWADHEESLKTEQEKAAERDRQKDERIKELETSKLRGDISHTTGVPEALITGTTEEEMKTAAKIAQDFKGTAQPTLPNSSAAPASSVTSNETIGGPKQVMTRDELAKLPPGERMKAWREGRLTHLGAPPPPERPSLKVNT